ncbi:SAM-dependent methyltransferase, partial [Streptomyces nanshensis]
AVSVEAARRTPGGVAVHDGRPPLPELLDGSARAWARRLLAPLEDNLAGAERRRLLEVCRAAVFMGAQGAAQLLGLHRDTVISRLEELTARVGLDRALLADRAQLDLALRLEDLPPPVPDTAPAGGVRQVLDDEGAAMWGEGVLSGLSSRLLSALVTWVEHELEPEETARELGISESTLGGWLREAGTLTHLPLRKDRPGAVHELLWALYATGHVRPAAVTGSEGTAEGAEGTEGAEDIEGHEEWEGRERREGRERPGDGEAARPYAAHRRTAPRTERRGTRGGEPGAARSTDGEAGGEAGAETGGGAPTETGVGTAMAGLARLRTDRPHPARLYDYFLGGRTNFAADRTAAQQTVEATPTVAVMARENRAFMLRAVRHLAGREGIRQFLDLGTGIPTEPNLHQVAQSEVPAARVVYVDDDPVVHAHAQALLPGSPLGRTAFLRADAADPAAVLDSPEVRDCLDLDQPVALSLMALLPLVTDDRAAREMIRGFTAALSSGSCLTLSHLTADRDPEGMEAARRQYEKLSGVRIRTRSRDELAALLDGLELLPPGIVLVHRWRSDRSEADLADDDARVGSYGAVARVP